MQGRGRLLLPTGSGRFDAMTHYIRPRPFESRAQRPGFTWFENRAGRKSAALTLATSTGAGSVRWAECPNRGVGSKYGEIGSVGRVGGWGGPIAISRVGCRDRGSDSAQPARRVGWRGGGSTQCRGGAVAPADG